MQVPSEMRDFNVRTLSSKCGTQKNNQKHTHVLRMSSGVPLGQWRSEFDTYCVDVHLLVARGQIPSERQLARAYKLALKK